MRPPSSSGSAAPTNRGSTAVPTALAYGAYVADVFLPMVIPFIPGTNALWDPWQGSHNGKGLTEDAFDNATKVILNQDFVPGLTQPGEAPRLLPLPRPAAGKLNPAAGPSLRLHAFAQ